MKIDKEKVRTILFITLSNLGDIILTTPVLEKLHDEFPGAEIDVVTGLPGDEIFLLHPAVRDVIIHKKDRSLGEYFEYIRDLRRAKYDLVVDLKNSLIPYIVGAKHRTGIFNVNPLYKRPSGIHTGHKKDEHLAKLAGLGIDPFSGNRFFMPVIEQEEKTVEETLKSAGDRKIVIINPGAKSHLKRWGAENFAALSDKLVSDTGCKILVVGNEDDKEVVEKFMSCVKEEVTDLSRRTSLGLLTGFIKRADLLVTNDSAPMHVASAVDTPVIAIFGPSDEKKYGPLSKKSRVLNPDVPCRPCGRALCRVGPDEGCLPGLSVEKVFDAAKEVLYG